MQDLFSALEANTTCYKLYTSGHAITATAVSRLASMLQTNLTLTHICIGDSTFGDTGLAALSPALKLSRSLRAVDLENKGITSAGLQQLVLDLQGSPLSDLSLSRNRFSAGGFEALCAAPLPVSHLSLRSCGLRGAELSGTERARMAHCL
jgi:hypothetical protein